MIKRIGANFNPPKLNSANFGRYGEPRIMYGIPNRWDSYARPTYRPAPLIKYGVPNEPSLDEISPDTENRGEEPIVKYGVPQRPSLSDVHTRIREDLESDEARFMYGIPAAETTNQDVQDPETESVEEESDIEEPVAQEPKSKPSYFKRLFLAIIGKDC